ncbi:MAG: DUF3298 domain-containing protein, partial [Clostridiales bacterium]|nr:DUF3298 domain-containing protein [Clostridiales bacterium]
MRYKTAALLAAILFLLPATAYAESKDAQPLGVRVDVFVNGQKLRGQCGLAGDTTYAPLEELAQALGAEFELDGEKLSIKRGDTFIRASLGSTDVATSSGHSSAPAPFALGETIYIPLRFTVEALGDCVAYSAIDPFLDGRVRLQPQAYVGSSNPVSLKSGAKVHTTYVQGKRESKVTGQTASIFRMIPVFSDLESTSLLDKANALFSARLDASKKEFEAELQGLDFNSTSLEALSPPYTYESSSFYRIYEPLPNCIESLSLDYVYSGGAHGIESLKSAVLDLEGEKVLTLYELFKDPVACKAILLEDIAEVAANGGSYYDAVQGVTAELLDKANEERNFFLTEDAVVVYFQPYEIAPYAAGVVKFPITLKELAD